MYRLTGLLFIFTLITLLAWPVYGQAKNLVSRYPPFVRKPPASTLKLDVPFHHQQHKLSCEAATLRMLLLYKGIDEPEDSIIAKTPVGPMGADPDQVYVGSIDGVQFVSGYGIHWEGLSNVARTYLPASTFHQVDLHFLIDRLHEGKPLIIWGSFVRNPRDASWTTPEGKYVHAVRGEHTFVVTGYAGPRREPTHIFTIDPLSGEWVFRTGDFIKNWEFYYNSGMFF